jgi:transcriptional/translational regulatory protein YebC/TACO1
MAGHSKWSKVQHIKGPLDQKRGQLFSKLAAEITVAAKMGGGDLGGNPRLRSVILAASAQSMPNDPIARAVARGLELAPEDRSHKAADRRLILTKNHGSLASSVPGSCIFHRKGRVTVPAATILGKRLFDLAIEAGGEDLAQEDEHYVITTVSDPLFVAAKAFKNAGVQADASTEEVLTPLPH